MEHAKRRLVGGVVRRRGRLSGVRRPGRTASSARAYGRIWIGPWKRGDGRVPLQWPGSDGTTYRRWLTLSRYLFRVGQSRTRGRKQRTNLISRPENNEVWVEPGLPKALGDLPERQRVVVYLVHAYGVPVQEVAGLLGLRDSTVRTHLRRALSSLRHSLKVDESSIPGHPTRQPKGKDVTNGA